MTQGRVFGAGLVVGGLLAGSLVLIAGDPAGGSSAIAAASDAGADPRDALTDEVAKLRAELERERARGTRTEVGGAAAPAATADPIPLPVAPTGGATGHRSTDIMLADVEDLLRSGLLAAQLDRAPEQFAPILLQAWCDAGRPERALALIERTGLVNELHGYLSWIGGQLEQRGDRPVAARAYLLALTEAPSDWESVLRLAELDPAAALQQREATPITDPDAEFRSQQALLLLAAGRDDEALQAIDTLIAADELSPAIWDGLVARNPVAAEERLRARIAVADGDLRPFLQIHRAAALRRQGKSSEARRELDAILSAAPDHAEAVAALGELDRRVAIDHLQRRASNAPSGHVYSMLGEQLLQAGRREEAVGAFLDAWTLSPADGHEGRLLQLAPDRFAPRFAERAAATNDDELFGDVADALWPAGRRTEAIAYWRRAREIDPDDGEWQLKLRRVEQGRDPLQ